MKHLLIPIIVLLASCSRYEPQNAELVDALPQIYPDYTFVTVPANIAPLNFQSCDSSAQAICVTFKGKDSELTCSARQCIDINIGKWHKLLNNNIGDSLTVSVSLLKNDKWQTFKAFPIYISPDSIDYGVHYRLIAPGYGFFSDMGLYERNLSNFDVDVIYAGSQIEGGCMNCHTANRCNTQFSSTHYRGEHGATVIRRGNNYEAFNLKPTSADLPCVYTYWHPSGRYVGYSQHATQQVYFMIHKKKLEVYDDGSDIAILDIDNQQLITSPLLKTDWYETAPTFSPDGKTMYYTSSAPCDLPSENEKAVYVLCAISFDDEAGVFGQSVDTLLDLRAQGKSIAWTRPSYDGKYILFTMADYGQFSIWHPESDLWIYDLETKETHPLTLANSNDAESFHNWSSNSRWITFTSRRDDGYFSLLYIAHIDDNGNAAKAFALPQRNPRQHYDEELKSYNLPDFCTAPTRYNANLVESMLFGSQRNSVSYK